MCLMLCRSPCLPPHSPLLLLPQHNPPPPQGMMHGLQRVQRSWVWTWAVSWRRTRAGQHTQWQQQQVQQLLMEPQRETLGSSSRRALSGSRAVRGVALPRQQLWLLLVPAAAWVPLPVCWLMEVPSVLHQHWRPSLIRGA